MKLVTKQLFARFIFEVEQRELLNVGTCACSRPRERLMTAAMRETLDKLAAAVAEEPETVDASRISLVEVD